MDSVWYYFSGMSYFSGADCVTVNNKYFYRIDIIVIKSILSADCP